MDLSFVDVDWIKAKMRELNIRYTDIVEAFDGNKGNISSTLNGNRGLSTMGRAAFYYYFKTIEQANK